MGIDDVQENARQVTHDCAIDFIVYVDMTGIYRKLDYNKQVLYKIKEVLKYNTVQFQWGKEN